MANVWYLIVCLMLSTYVVLDGFDFGVGILHLFVAKCDEERRTVLAAIGPFWDGNEVWLLAGGGILFFAFPRAYAASFSGFYIPLMMVLWLLILRGISIEFRSLENSPIWRSTWDGVFFISSALMAIVLGAALGNVIRGVPLSAEGYFSGPLFTNFMPSRDPGVLDWYTVILGVFALLVLAMHRANFLRMKVTGPVRERASVAANYLWIGVVGVGVLMTIVTHFIQPSLYETMLSRLICWPFILINFGALAAVKIAYRRGSESGPFIASSVMIASSLATAGAGLFPVILHSTHEASSDITVENAAAGSLNLHAGFVFWMIALTLAVFYFAFLFRSFKGKVNLATSGH